MKTVALFGVVAALFVGALIDCGVPVQQAAAVNGSTPAALVTTTADNSSYLVIDKDELGPNAEIIKYLASASREEVEEIVDSNPVLQSVLLARVKAAIGQKLAGGAANTPPVFKQHQQQLFQQQQQPLQPLSIQQVAPAAKNDVNVYVMPNFVVAGDGGAHEYGSKDKKHKDKDKFKDGGGGGGDPKKAAKVYKLGKGFKDKFLKKGKKGGFWLPPGQFGDDQSIAFDNGAQLRPIIVVVPVGGGGGAESGWPSQFEVDRRR